MDASINLGGRSPALSRHRLEDRIKSVFPYHPEHLLPTKAFEDVYRTSC